MALSFVQHSTNNLSIHHRLFNKSYNTSSSSLKLHSSSASAARLCSGLRTSFGSVPPPPCSILRSTRQCRRYNKVSLSDDAAADDDDFYTFEKFTEKAMDIVTLAKDEAKRSGYDLFGAEHVLLAIISEGTSIAADILTESMKIENVEEAREAVKTFTKQGSRFDANRVFKLSIDISRKLGHDYVDVEHILLALIPADESNRTIVPDILKMFGVDPASTRKQLLQRMDPQKMVMLEKYGTNLTKEGVQADFFVGHAKEVVEGVLNNLCSCNPIRRNPCLIGESRVANTEIVRQLAQQIACGKAPGEISGKEVIMLHTKSLVDAPEEYRKELFQEIKAQSDKIIIFVDDIQSLATTMGENRLGDLIESGELQCIGASTQLKYFHFLRNFVNAKDVIKQFLEVEVAEPSITESIFILRDFVSGKLCISDEDLLASVYLSRKYYETDSFLDEAFDLIEDANSLIKKYNRQNITEADIRIIVSLRYGVRVEEIAAIKDIVADITLTDEINDSFWDENATCVYFTKRLRDRLARSYNPTEFLEGTADSLVDSKVLSDLRDTIEREIVKRDIEDDDIVVDFDAADNSFIVHELVKARYKFND